MPLFRSSPPPPPPPPAEPPSRSRSIFSRRADSPEPAPSTTNDSTRSGHSGGFFSLHRSSSSDDDSHSRSSNTDLRRDPAIMAARQKVTDAESAERAADHALVQARAAVRGAREHVKQLERDALEDSRRAKARQAEVLNVSRSARGLGRHG